MINKNTIFNNILNNINIESDVDFRDIYNDAMQFNKYNSMEIGENILYRFMVNSIRHSYSNYEDHLKLIHRLDNNKDVYYTIYKNNVLNAISSAYPQLQSECRRQTKQIPMIKYTKAG